MKMCKILPSVPRVGPILWVDPVGLRWARGKVQRLFTCGRRLGDVVTDSCRGVLRPSDLRMTEIVRWKSKWYSRNYRRLSCFREAAVIAVQVRVGSIDRAFLHGLATHTDGLSVVFFPPSECKACCEEFVSRTQLHCQNCQRMPELAAQPAPASKRRLTDQWHVEWRAAPTA